VSPASTPFENGNGPSPDGGGKQTRFEADGIRFLLENSSDAHHCAAMLPRKKENGSPHSSQRAALLPSKYQTSF
jgi:hypothetical protein